MALRPFRLQPAFQEAAAWWRSDVNLTDPGLDPVLVHTIETSANLFRLLGVSPQVGPGFPREDQLHNPSELQAVISDRLWRTRYDADKGLVGRQLSLNGTPYTIVGVMPPGFRFPDDIDVWQRLRWNLSQHSRSAHFMEGVARLADGVTQERAMAEARALATRLGVEFEASNPPKCSPSTDRLGKRESASVRRGGRRQLDRPASSKRFSRLASTKLQALSK
jgi:putative ABC transport system permease protein